jgi:ABC-2 type transport system permease protein
VRIQWLNYISGFIATDVNKQLLTEAVGQAREAASGLQGLSTSLLDRVVEVGDALKSEDLETAKERLDELLVLLEEEEDRIEPLLWGLLGVESRGNTLYVPGDRPALLATTLALFQRAHDDVARLRQLLDDPALDPPAIVAQVKALRDRVAELQAMADLMEAIPDKVLVSPVTTEIVNLSPSEPDYMSFYAPAVLALLLQHIAVTFGSLTMVRERLLGAEELFRVAPIAPWEIVSGKYLSYSLLTVAIGLVLSILIVAVMQVPLLGSVPYLLLVLILVALAGLGWGLFVSLLSKRESQAVQFSMLILLASVFFGGFFLPLSGLLPSVHFVSYALPVTYGVQALREIMLAGRVPGVELLLPLAGMSVGFYALCVLIYSWQHKRE